MADTVETKAIAIVNKADEDVINNIELLLNIEVLEESDIWDDLAEFVKMDAQDEPVLPESEKR